MDRQIVYDGALPQTTDILDTNKFALLGLSYLNQALLGTNTVVGGLACTPTSPASLIVNVGPGTIYQVDPTDQAAYADLGTDIINIMKQGIIRTTTPLTLTPPVTGGQSQVYLIEAILNDVDSGSTVLSYYNSANPAQPFSGPNNSGASNFTIRTNPCVVTLKAGTPATTGTQVAPLPDPGFVGLYTITVANGQTQITGGQIIQLTTAPFIPLLPQVPTNVQSGTWTYCVDTGILNHLQITPVPNCTALVTGMGFRVKVLVTNTLASDITINYINASGVASTLGPVTIHRGSTAGTAANDLFSGAVIDLVYDGTFFQMVNYLGSGTNTNTNTTIGIPYIADSGATNALVATFSPTVLPLVAGTTIAVKLANTITGACTINCNGGGLKNVTLGDLTVQLPFNVFTAGMVLVMEYDGTQFQIINTSIGMFTNLVPTSNYNIFVNTSTGSDTAFNGFSATVSGSAGPFKTIQKAMNVAWGFSPSSTFTITINIAAGTYTENPVSPTNPGNNIIISGAGIGSTVIASASAGLTGMILATATAVTVQNLTFSGAALSGIFCEIGANVNVTNVAFNNTCSIGPLVWAAYSGLITVGSGCTIGGSCNAVFAGQSGGSVIFKQVNITISGSISVASGFAFAVNGGTVTNGTASTPPTFINAGFVSGPKYFASGNGIVWAQAQGVNFFPGNVAGSTNTGGQYIP